ncbi:MAG TPA: hypothetical protein ENN12_01625 [Epsilonproteobacteria bacterium]|nr:hypothetical protein [Campylobacterota bacterium]
MSTCPWCGDEDCFEESVNEGAFGNIVLELECSACGEFETHEYGYSIDFEKYAEENSLLFSGVCCPECYQDMCDEDDGTPYDEIEIQVEDSTFGILYTFNADLLNNEDEDETTLFEQEPFAEVNDCSKRVLANVSEQVVKLNNADYLNIYISYLVNRNESIETLIKCVWDECLKQNKKEQFESFLKHIVSRLDLEEDDGENAKNAYDETCLVAIELLGEMHPWVKAIKEK